MAYARGSEFPILASLSPLNTNGEPMVIATVRDLSELRRLEEGHAALEAANRELRQLLTLTDTALSNLALDELMGELMGRAREVIRVDNVAILLLGESGQELRVSAASGFEEQLAAQSPIPIGHGFTGRIASTRAPLIVDDLSTFPVVVAILTPRRAGKLALQLAPCDLTTIVSEQFAAQQERMIQLELPDDRLVMVMADADRIGEVLANYLSNALKYSPADRPITVRLEVAAGRANVAVRDRGPGLPPMEQALVWEMFHRAPGVSARNAVERRGASLGLGPHICKRLIEAHPGGEVGVENEVASGSTFWFALPLLSDIPSTDASQAPHEDGTNRA